MLGKEYTFKQKIEELREREKELKAIYKVEEAIQRKLPVDAFFSEIIKRIPTGWQYPEICRVKITYNDLFTGNQVGKRRNGARKHLWKLMKKSAERSRYFIPLSEKW
jgi:hypothetical protein